MRNCVGFLQIGSHILAKIMILFFLINVDQIGTFDLRLSYIIKISIFG